jgi:hypothetical protein
MIGASHIDPHSFVYGLQSLWNDFTQNINQGSDIHSDQHVTPEFDDKSFDEMADIFHEEQLREALADQIQPVPAAKKGGGGVQPVSVGKKSGGGVQPVSVGKKSGGGVQPVPAAKKGGGVPAGKKGKKKPGEQSIDWTKSFSICNLLSTAQLSKYNEQTQLMIGNLPAMSNPLTKNALNKYLTDQTHTTLLEYMSKFSQKYPAYYLKSIIDAIPNIKRPYTYVPWFGTRNIFNNVNEHDALISNESCFTRDPVKTESVKQNKLSHSYSPYILCVLFDVIARYRYCYGSESPRVLELMLRQDTIDSQLESFMESETKLSCPSYTSTLLDILQKNPSCRDKDSVEFKDCPYDLGSLDTLRKLMYQCMHNIQTVQSSLSETDQDNINKQILSNLVSKNLMLPDGSAVELTEIQELQKNQIIFSAYADFLSKLAQILTHSLTIINAENSKMLTELPGKKPNEILLLALLVRALQNGNSDFIEELSSDELMIDDDSNIVFKGNDGNESSELQIITAMKELLSKYIPKNCTGENAAKSICLDYQEAVKLRPMLSQKPPVPGSKSGVKGKATTPASAKKGPVKQIALSDKFNQKVMNNFAIQMAKVPLRKVSYTIK